MKKTILSVTVLLLAISIQSFAQVNVGPTEKANPSTKTEKFVQADLDAFKKTKTAFIYPEMAAAELENWKKVFAEVWTVTPIEFVSYDKFGSYQGKSNYSFISVSGVGYTYNGSADGLYVYLLLWKNGVDSKGKPERKNFFRIELSPDISTVLRVCGSDKNEMYSNINKGNYTNLYPGLLKIDLRIANDCLKAEELRFIRENATDANALSKLKDDTLFIPDYSLLGSSGANLDEAKIMASYTGDYKFISAKELSDKILSGEQIYYLIHTRSANEKYISVFNTESGKMIFSKYSIGSNLNAIDITAIEETINGPIEKK